MKKYKCCLCGRPTKVLHEVLFTGKQRQVCIDYFVQVPLCIDHHSQRHFSPDLTKHERRQMDIRFCELLGIDYYETLRAVINKHNRGYLELNKEKCAKKIKSWEV
jgi:hypothetical protein